METDLKTMTVKEWAEAYREINRIEEAERREQVRTRTIKRAIQDYIDLSDFVASFGSFDYEGWSKQQELYYLEVESNIKRIADKMGYVIPW